MKGRQIIAVLALSLAVGIVTATLGPGDQIFRLSDLPVWLGIGIATTFVLAVSVS